MYRNINEPSIAQRLLLQASLLQKEPALKAWREWQSMTDVDAIDVGSFRLLPLLYQQLLRFGVDEPAMQKYKGIYRFTWSKNQRLLFHLTPLLRDLNEAGISCTILKGGALIPLYYQDLGLRPMQDFDLLIPRARALQAIQMLLMKGWLPQDWKPGFAAKLEEIREIFFSIKHAHGFVLNGQVELDLHWNLFAEHCKEGIDDPILEASHPLEMQGVPVRTLDPTDQLFHICIHGASPNLIPPLRWVADAIFILRISKEIDAERLAFLARHFGYFAPLKEALDYLQRYFESPVPSRIIEHLEKEEKVIAAPSLANPAFKMPSFKDRILAHWKGHVRSTEHSNFFVQLLYFPRFLRVLWGLNSIFQLPTHIAARTIDWFQRRGRLKLKMLSRIFSL
jgi:hypothetical protein